MKDFEKSSAIRANDILRKNDFFFATLLLLDQSESDK